MKWRAALWSRIKRIRRAGVRSDSHDIDRSVHDNHRRELLKRSAIIGAAATAPLLLPTSWTKPVLRSVVVPAHAQTTPVTIESQGQAESQGQGQGHKKKHHGHKDDCLQGQGNGDCIPVCQSQEQGNGRLCVKPVIPG